MSPYQAARAPDRATRVHFKPQYLPVRPLLSHKRPSNMVPLISLAGDTCIQIRALTTQKGALATRQGAFMAQYEALMTLQKALMALWRVRGSFPVDSAVGLLWLGRGFSGLAKDTCGKIESPFEVLVGTQGAFLTGFDTKVGAIWPGNGVLVDLKGTSIIYSPTGT